MMSKTTLAALRSKQPGSGTKRFAADLDALIAATLGDAPLGAATLRATGRRFFFDRIISGPTNLA
jgi:uncharacterized protein (DUF2267 family)